MAIVTPDTQSGDDPSNTPLTAEEQVQLIPAYITFRHELNEAEQANVADAVRWAETQRRAIVDRAFLCELHRRMFCDVWRWAGRYRTTARNIGVDAYRIPQDVQQAVDDTRYWVANATYSPDEIAIRFSHRLVAIHPFPNGNGRFSRLAGDLLARRLDRPFFSWGQKSTVDDTTLRNRYIEVLQAADRHDFAGLIRFARS